MGIESALFLSSAAIGGGAIAGTVSGGSALTGAAIGAQIAGPLTSLMGSINEGQQAKQWSKFQNKQAKYDAMANYSLAKLQANTIREKAKAQIKGMAADTASAGVVVGSGADDQAMRDILEAGEYDAQMTMYNANDELARAMQGIKINKLTAKQAEEKQKFSYLGGLLNLGMAGMGAYDKWKTMKKTDNGDTTGDKPTLSPLNNAGVVKQ